MHKPDHLRQAFQEYLDSGPPPGKFTVKLGNVPISLDLLLGRLWNCTDILPAEYCDQLDLPKGSTYAKAARQMKKTLWPAQ